MSIRTRHARLPEDRCIDSNCDLWAGHLGQHFDETDGARWVNLDDVDPEMDPYVEAADANPERRNNGCQIYRSAP